MSIISARQLDDIIECPICLDLFDDPRLLPCGHSCCLHCLEQLGKSADRRRSAPSCGRYENDELACPICRKQFNVPRSTPTSDRRFSDMPKNFSILKLLLLVTQAGEGITVPCRKNSPCDSCSSTNDVVSGRMKHELAMFYCVDCSRNLCNTCRADHLSDKVTALHRPVPLTGRRVFRGAGETQRRGQTIAPSGAGSPSTLSECSRHGGDATIQLYCQDCRKALCVICYIDGGHSAHRCVHVKDAVGGLRSQLVSGADALGSAVTSCQRSREVLNDEHHHFLALVDGITHMIHDRADQLRHDIERATEELIGRVEATKAKKLSRSEQAHHVINDREEAMVSLLVDVKSVVNDGIASDIVRRSVELHDEVSRCIALSLEAVNNELLGVKAIQIAFTESTKEDFNAKLLFGDVQVSDESDGVHACRPKLVQAIPSTGGGVYAMTLLGNRLFVVRHGALQVDVYDAASLPLTLHGSIVVPDLGTVSYGLAATSGPDNRCLYVSDYNANRVHLVDLVHIPDDGQDVNTADDEMLVLTEPRSWAVGTQPAGLSTTESGSVLVTCYGAGEIQEYRRESRATEASHHRRQAMVTMTMVRVIRLRPDVTYPWHTVCLSTNGGIKQYIVTVSGTDHGICIVNEEGVIHRKFVGSNAAAAAAACAGDHSIRMKSPRCLTVCGHSTRRGTLLVADQCNHRILLVDQSLTHASQLPIDAGNVTCSAAGSCSGGLQLPGGLCLDEAQGRLYVGEWIGGRVFVYDNVVDYIDSNL